MKGIFVSEERVRAALQWAVRRMVDGFPYEKLGVPKQKRPLANKATEERIRRRGLLEKYLEEEMAQAARDIIESTLEW